MGNKEISALLVCPINYTPHSQYTYVQRSPWFSNFYVQMVEPKFQSECLDLNVLVASYRLWMLKV